ncbi:MAG: diguanylate cyclase [Burkholderiales bacterium]|nr:diguanylate cyclase [Burkholderiales bacterium]
MATSDMHVQKDEWVSSPEFMRGALLTLIVGALVSIVVIRWMAPEQPARALGPIGALLLALVAWRVLVVKGVETAKQVLGVGGLVYSLLLSYLVAGVLTPVIIALPVLLTLIGWLFNPRAAIWATGFTIVALWGMVWGADAGWVPTSVRTTPAMYAVIQSLMLLLTVYMTVYVFNRYTDRVRQITLASDELRLRTQELEASKLRLQTVIEVSGTVFWEYHIQTDTLTYDTSRLPVLGLDATQPPVTVRDWVTLVHPDDKHRFLDMFQGTIRQVLPNLDHDYRVKGASNEWVWMSTRGAVIRYGDDGLPTVLGGAAVNIQARKEAEMALKASEQTSQHLAHMLRSLCDNVPDMIWAKDLNKRYIFANRAICDQLLMSHSTDEPVGKDDMYFASRERASRPAILDWHTFGELCQDSDAVTLQRGQPSQFEEFGHVKGRMLVLDVRKAPFVNDRGEVVGVVGTGRDITDHKAAQDRLRLAALVLDRSSEALMITDEANVIVEVNPAFTAQTGYSRDDVLGQKPSILRSDMQGPDFYRLMWEALKAEGKWQGEIWNRRKNGELFVEWLTINTLYTEEGLPFRRVALFSDVTENKKKEELLWQQANFDMLTLLPNRRMFQDRLDVELKKLRRTGNKLAVFFLDLDRFKDVNDSLGHHVGDVLLRQAAKRILACVRESDTVARLGGDEFTVILTDIENAASVERVAQTIVDSLSQPFDLDGHLAEVSASLGIAIGPDHASEPAILVQKADQAMYAAKQAGRNGYRFSRSVV